VTNGYFYGALKLAQLVQTHSINSRFCNLVESFYWWWERATR